jgi:hypothetical protein
MDEHHPKIKKYMKDWSQYCGDDRSEVYEVSALMMPFYRPEDRVKFLSNVEDNLRADEGTLRQRAQLLSLHRHWSLADEKLRKAGR